MKQIMILSLCLATLQHQLSRCSDNSSFSESLIEQLPANSFAFCKINENRDQKLNQSQQPAIRFITPVANTQMNNACDLYVVVNQKNLYSGSLKENLLTLHPVAWANPKNHSTPQSFSALSNHFLNDKTKNIKIFFSPEDNKKTIFELLINPQKNTIIESSVKKLYSHDTPITTILCNNQDLFSVSEFPSTKYLDLTKNRSWLDTLTHQTDNFFSLLDLALRPKTELLSISETTNPEDAASAKVYFFLIHDQSKMHLYQNLKAGATGGMKAMYFALKNLVNEQKKESSLKKNEAQPQLYFSYNKEAIQPLNNLVPRSTEQSIKTIKGIWQSYYSVSTAGIIVNYEKIIPAQKIVHLESGQQKTKILAEQKELITQVNECRINQTTKSFQLIDDKTLSDSSQECNFFLCNYRSKICTISLYNEKIIISGKTKYSNDYYSLKNFNIKSIIAATIVEYGNASLGGTKRLYIAYKDTKDELYLGVINLMALLTKDDDNVF